MPDAGGRTNHFVETKRQLATSERLHSTGAPDCCGYRNDNRHHDHSVAFYRDEPVSPAIFGCGLGRTAAARAHSGGEGQPDLHVANRAACAGRVYLHAGLSGPEWKSGSGCWGADDSVAEKRDAGDGRRYSCHTQCIPRIHSATYNRSGQLQCARNTQAPLGAGTSWSAVSIGPSGRFRAWSYSNATWSY